MRRPSSLSPWRSAFLIYLAAFAAFIAMYLPQPILPLLSADFEVSASTAGLLISALVLSVAFMSLVVAPLSDRVGRKPILVGCSLLLALPSLACALATDFSHLVVMRFLQGALVPGVLAVSVAYLSEEFAPRHVPVLVGGYISATVVGGMTSRLLSGAVSDFFDWRWAFGVSSLFSLAVGLVLLVLLPSSSYFRATENLRGAYRGMAAHLRDSRLVGGYLVGSLLFFAFLGLFTYLPFHLAGPPYHFPPLRIGLIFLVYGAGAISSPLVGRLTRRFQFWKILAGALFVTLTANLLTLAPSTAVLIGALLLLCFANFVVQSTATAFVAATAAHDRAGANALYLFCYYVGGSLGGYLPGLLWPLYGWAGVLALTMTSLTFAIVVALTLCRPRDRSRSGLGSRPTQNDPR